MIETNIIKVDAVGHLMWRGTTYKCVLGKSGVTDKKQEGDGKTPLGTFALREVFYRPDRLSAPKTAMPVSALSENDGWCDDPNHADYNTKILLPHPARAENLWREDAVYDVIVVLGYNDQPVKKGQGSAIFMHVAKPDYAPTEGCVALELNDLLEVLEALRTSDHINISGS